jgi:CubicO group peptidase (beta-lactamase class C family)
MIFNISKKAEIFISAFFCLLMSSSFANDLNQVFDQNKFQEFESWVFDESDTKKTESLLILHKGKMIFERYSIGDPNKKYLLWSISKTITSLIFAKAEEEGLISRFDPIKKYFSEFEGQPVGEIKLLDFLNMSSGIEWNEFYEENPFMSHVVRMLYLEKDMVGYVLKQKISHPAGKHFYYSSGDTVVIAGALKKALKEKYDAYPWEKIFHPMQMQVKFEQDSEGVFVGASYAYMRAIDLAKIGQLLLDKGRYQGIQILKEETVQRLITPNETMKYNCQKDHLTYGMQIWLNSTCPVTNQKYYPHLSEKVILFLGHHGQSVHILPEKNLVVVRSATDQAQKMDRQTFTKLLSEAIK